MLEEKNSLPGAELHFSIDNRDRFARPGQHHPDMRGAVVAAFAPVHEVIGVFWHQSLEKFLQIFSRRRIRVLHHDETATGVLNKNRDRPVAHTGLVDLALDLIGNFVGAFPARANLELVVMNAHAHDISQTCRGRCQRPI